MVMMDNAKPLTSEHEREVLFTALYEKLFPAVSKFVANRNGTADDAKDIFHDALIVFYETSRKEEIHLSVEAYVFGIVKHLWNKKFKDDQIVLLGELESIISIPEKPVCTPDEKSILNLLKSAGQKCVNLLTSFYFHNTALDKIKLEFGFGSVRSATVQKFKCIEKLREEVKRKSMNYEDFIE